MRLKSIAAPVLGGPESVRVVCYSQQQHPLVESNAVRDLRGRSPAAPTVPTYDAAASSKYWCGFYTLFEVLVRRLHNGH